MLEDRSRGNNIGIDGVKEAKGETWNDCENFKELPKTLIVRFSAISLSETLCESEEKPLNLNYILSGYNYFS